MGGHGMRIAETAGVGATARRAVRDPWLLPVAATPLLGVALVSDARPGMRTGSLALATLLLFGTVVGVARERLRARAVEMLVECAIATAAIVFLASGLGVVTVWPEPSDAADIAAMGSAVVAVFAATCIGWLASIDADARNASLGCVGAAAAACGAAGMILGRGMRPVTSPTWANAAVVVAIVAIVGAIVHDSRPRLRTPVLDLTRGHVARRAALTLGVVLVGPVLLVAPLGVGPLPVPLVAGASVGLTLLAISHVYRLLRRWGSLEHDVFHDDLTGLPNRLYFNQRLHLAIEHARDNGHELEVLFLDLDHFKQVNDTLGHAAGNDLLVGVANRVRAALGERHTFARFGGDEFAVLVPLLSGRSDGHDATKRILDAFATPFEVGSRRVYITPSIGAAHYPTDGRDASALLEHADIAMYRAKSRRREAQRGLTPALPVEPSREVTAALRRAINEDRLVLHYQPKIDLRSGRVVAVEALLRWRHPAGGLILPDSFLPIAEENGMMAPLAEWVLLEACAEARRWVDAGAPPVRMSVNLSPSQLAERRVPELVERVLRFTKLPHELLELEIDARAFQRGRDGLDRDLAALRDLGVRCVIDDFASIRDLDRLEHAAITGIELGRRHVGVITSGGGRVATAVLAAGRSLGIDTTAEGVETPDQLRFLHDRGCTIAQGHLFARAAPGHEVLHLLDLQFDENGDSTPATAHSHPHASGA